MPFFGIGKMVVSFNLSQQLTPPSHFTRLKTLSLSSTPLYMYLIVSGILLVIALDLPFYNNYIELTITFPVHIQV